MKKRKKSEEGKQEKMSAKEYARQLRLLQVELCKLQAWVKHKGLRIIVVLEGRDGAERAARSKRSLSVSARVCSEPLLFPLHRIAKKVRCTCSATRRTSRQPARS